MTTRGPGTSARVKLMLSYSGVIMIAGALLLAIVWVFLLRYVPEQSVPGAAFTPSRDDLVRAFAPRATWAMLALLAFGLVAGWLLAGRMLAPLTRITAATRAAAKGDLSHRIDLEGRRDEFRELADSFDAMLARIQAQIGEQERFAANASHELRTPLAITQAMLDVARREPPDDARALVEGLHAVNVRAIALTEALLLLSRADQRAFAHSSVDLSLVAEEAVEHLLPLAEARGVGIEASGTISIAAGSHTLLQQLATNLVHNAVVHNVPHGAVFLTTAQHDGIAMLRVENTGPTLDPGVIATLTEPFQRGTERIRTDHAGVGLGLAIAKSIVRAHDGTIELSPRTGGGLVVTVRLPTAPKSAP